MGNIMIPQELFQQLIRYHLLEDNSCMEEIQRGLERKLDSLVLHELYGNTRRLLLRKNVKKPDRNIWIGEVCRTDFDGNSSLTDTDGSVTRSCREADKESPRQGAKALLMDGIGCQKCFCVTFGKVTKLMRRIRR